MSEMVNVDPIARISGNESVQLVALKAEISENTTHSVN